MNPKDNNEPTNWRERLHSLPSDTPDAPPSKPILWFASGLLAAFFMPWVQLLGAGLSGYQIGNLGSYANFVWIIPILAGATVAVSLSGKDNRVVGGFAGIAPILALLYAFIRFCSEAGPNAAGQISEIAQHVFSIGAYLTLIFAVCLLVVAFSRTPAFPSPTPQLPQDKIAQLERLADLRAKGILTEPEFEAQKKQILQ